MSGILLITTSSNETCYCLEEYGVNIDYCRFNFITETNKTVCLIRDLNVNNSCGCGINASSGIPCIYRGVLSTNCHNNEPIENVAIISICTGGSGILVITGIIYYLTRNNNKKKNNNRDDNQNELEEIVRPM